jgi:hypothetical protein
MEETSRECLSIIVILVKKMIAFKGDKPFCDLQCRVCGGWVTRDCLFGRLHMRMLSTLCLAKGVLLEEEHILGLWRDNIVLDSRKLDVTPPEYIHEVLN